MFLGRQNELLVLDKQYQNKNASLVVLYGRRRVGKSMLLKSFSEKKPTLFIEGIEGEKTPGQILSFKNQMKQQSMTSNMDKYLLSNWSQIFDYLTEYLSKPSPKKKIIILDEFQWLSAGQSKLVALIKYYWDNHWKDLNVMFVLCGSIASFMVKKVIHSKALYGRINLELCVRPLKLNEAIHFFKGTSKHEVLKYFIILGTIPKYLEEIDTKKSFDTNMINLFYKPNSYFLSEIDKVFYSQFKEAKNYRLIVESLISKPMTKEEIGRKIKIGSGGGVNTYINNLALSNFIAPIVNLSQKSKKMVRYKVIDEYLIFYYKFIAPYSKDIEAGRGTAIYNNLIKNKWGPWLGFAFENLCVQHANEITKLLDIDDQVISIGSYQTFGNKGLNKQGLQIDLIFKHYDERITVFEIKHNSQPLQTNLIAELELKLSKISEFQSKTIEKGLIYSGQLSEKLKKAEYFDYLIGCDQLLKTNF